MKPKLILFLLALAAPAASADALSQADREALLERLESIRKEADSKVDARFRTAISAFRSAMASENAALELYMKCEEMVNFERMQRSTSDFREWRRKHSDRLSDSGFKTALRHQLRWLVLTLEAASEDPDRDKLAAEGQRILEAIMSQAADLADHRGILQQSVTETVFARAYEINGIKVENWPLAPAAVQAVYEQVLLPPLRRADRLDSLKAAWTRRMLHESMIADLWTRKPGEKGRSGVRSPEYDRFVSATLPRLQWDSEVDLFKAGDQRGAAIRMLTHIEKNITHEAAPEWAASFTTLLQASPEVYPPSAETTPAP